MMMHLPGTHLNQFQEFALVAAFTGAALWLGFTFFYPNFLPEGGPGPLRWGLLALELFVIALFLGAPWVHLAISRKNQELRLDAKHLRVDGMGMLRIETRWVDRQKVLRVEQVIPIVGHGHQARKGHPFVRVTTRDTVLDFGRGLHPAESRWLAEELRGHLGL